MELSEEIYEILKSGKIPNYAMLADWYRRVTQLKSSLADAREEIEATQEAHRVVMAEKCAEDEVHCTCVPFLREEIKRLREMTKGISYSQFLWDELSEGNITEEEYDLKMKDVPCPTKTT